MPSKTHSEELKSAVRHALEATRAVAICPFHLDVIIRVGDDAAETHAFLRVKKNRRSDGKPWRADSLRAEFKRQLAKTADHYCPLCSGKSKP
jgi:hypothetical protein